MPDTPLTSKFLGASVPDTSTTLFAGPSVVTTAVFVALSDSETDVLYVEDATFAANSGYAVIGSELIFYGSRFGIDQLRDLVRGVNGTTPASHAKSASVELHPTYYVPKAIVDAIIELQTRLIALEP